jgi:hypothetical protein
VVAFSFAHVDVSSEIEISSGKETSNSGSENSGFWGDSSLISGIFSTWSGAWVEFELEGVDWDSVGCTLRGCMATLLLRGGFALGVTRYSCQGYPSKFLRTGASPSSNEYR